MGARSQVYHQLSDVNEESRHAKRNLRKCVLVYSHSLALESCVGVGNHVAIFGARFPTEDSTSSLAFLLGPPVTAVKLFSDRVFFTKFRRPEPNKFQATPREMEPRGSLELYNISTIIVVTQIRSFSKRF